ncbi:hypothetical protein ACFL6W_06565 [Thermodesulfobacteriota bacterium]
MYDIEMQKMSQEFFNCWQAAGLYLSDRAQEGKLSWIRAHPYPPFLEHLSFRLGNQLFFIRVEDIDGTVEGPGTLEGLNTVAEGSGGHACIMPMRKKFAGEEWVPDTGGWGLIDASNGDPVDPFSLVTDEKIEMTPWELHDMAVQIVREYIEKKDFQLMSWQSTLDVDPSIWFTGESNGPEWVVVRATKYPEAHASLPENWKEIVQQCTSVSQTGYFASVAIASSEQKFESENEEAVPLYRGASMYIQFPGLEGLEE